MRHVTVCNPHCLPLYLYLYVRVTACVSSTFHMQVSLTKNRHDGMTDVVVIDFCVINLLLICFTPVNTLLVCLLCERARAQRPFPVPVFADSVAPAVGRRPSSARCGRRHHSPVPAGTLCWRCPSRTSRWAAGSWCPAPPPGQTIILVINPPSSRPPLPTAHPRYAFPKGPLPPRCRRRCHDSSLRTFCMTWSTK